MQTSRFQLGLIAVLAGGLGHALSSTTADAYPAGAAISTGTNPIQSVAGRINLGSVTTVDDVIGAGSDHDLVLTDIVISLSPNDDSCRGIGKARLQDDAGTTYADFVVSSAHLNYDQLQPTTFRSESGIHVPAGTNLSLDWGWDYWVCGYESYDLVYVLSGYLAQP